MTAGELTFIHHVFISYAHLDNQELIEGKKGWVANFHRALEIRVAQYLGNKPDIWRDPKLHGSDAFAETLITKVHGSAVMISILSPRYVRSEWTRRELSEFVNAAGGHPTFGDKYRIFKILKTPVPPDQHPSELRPLLGYEFFKVDGETGRPRELDEIFGSGAQCEFWMKVDDVAQDVCELLRLLETQKSDTTRSANPDKQPVFVAFTTSDVSEQREILCRDLQQHGYEVLPRRASITSLSEVESSFSEDLQRCRVSVHLVGSRYGPIPEDSAESLSEIQNRLVAERARSTDFTRIVWIPPGVHTSNERQLAFIQRLRREIESGRNADLLETPFEDLRSVVQDRLNQLSVPHRHPRKKSGQEKRLVHIYFVYDQRDLDSVGRCEDLLFNCGPEILHPMFDGDETEIRECHEEHLRMCDGVLIYYGAANELWLRRKLRDIQRIAGAGRTEPMRAVGILLAPPMRSDTTHFH